MPKPLLKFLFVFIGGGVGVTLFIRLLIPGSIADQWWLSVLYNGLLTLLLSYGNGFLTTYLSKSDGWQRRPFRTFYLVLGSSILYTMIAFIVFNIAFISIYNGRYIVPSWLFKPQSLGVAFVITALVSLFLHGRAFLTGWRDSALEAERLKQNQLVGQYEALKGQLNPHFLFNSLNVLSTLVYKDADLSARFIDQLSEVYRYVLSAQQEDLVPLSKEVEALQAYGFLLDIRFGEGFQLECPADAPDTLYLPPLTLQLLVENAVKHNIVARSRPLFVRVEWVDDHLVVTNNLQRKPRPEASTGIGLRNICRRYVLLGQPEPTITESEEAFTVSLPLLRQETSPLRRPDTTTTAA